MCNKFQSFDLCSQALNISPTRSGELTTRQNDYAIAQKRTYDTREKLNKRIRVKKN